MSETIDITNIDVTESELFVKELFEEKVLPPEHKFRISTFSHNG
jgi:hypothetical protein